MNRNARRIIVPAIVVVLVAGVALAQYRSRRGGGYRSPRVQDLTVDRNGVETWPVDPNFKTDLFTFVRIQYDDYYGPGRQWLTDYPDSDLNFSFRLQQLTSLKVDPNPKVHRLTDDAIFDYPFIYMIEPGSLQFSEEEIVALRRYCYNGGFLMVDDFWGPDEWNNFYDQIKRVFPDREPRELPLDHPVFSMVYKLTEKPQLPSINHAMSYRGTERTWEDSRDPEVHYQGIFDDNGRMMVIICHNTDLGDGWEREGENEYYFREFSEKKAYPMGINIVFYAMTH